MIAQVFDATGQPTGNQIVFTPYRNDEGYVTLVSLTNGKFAISQTYPSDSATVQIYNADGTPSGSPFVLNTTPSPYVTDIHMTSLSGGGFVATWCILCGGPAGEQTLTGQIFDSSGVRVGNEFSIPIPADTYTVLNFNLKGLSNGGFLIGWEQFAYASNNTINSQVVAQRYSAIGVAEGSQILAETDPKQLQSDFDMIQLTSGNIAFTWLESAENTYQCGATNLRARVFSSEGADLGRSVIVNTPDAGKWVLIPQILNAGDGGFDVLWNQSQAQCPYGIPDNENVLKLRYYQPN